MTTNNSTNRVAIVTGSSRGIGRGIALALAAQGWRIVINYHSNSEAAATTRADVSRRGRRCLGRAGGHGRSR